MARFRAPPSRTDGAAHLGDEAGDVATAQAAHQGGARLGEGERTGDNPTDGLTKVLPKHRDETTHHAALAYAQVPAFVEKLRASGATPATKYAFEFLILTASRTSEVIGATWDEFDLDAGVWVVPAARIKAGREHVVPRWRTW